MLIDFHAIDFYTRDSFDEMIEMRGNKPNILTSFWYILHAIIDRDIFW